MARIAYITAIYGSYECSAKPYESQSIPSDFICFTDNPDIEANEWSIDTTPYHILFPSEKDTHTMHNSVAVNKHTFNIAKYYKQNFHYIPRLQKYDVVVWLDGTVEIYNPKTSEIIMQYIKKSPIIGWSHEYRSGRLYEEFLESNHGEKYTSTFWIGQSQPYQDVHTQYESYVKAGYTDDFWSDYRKNNPNFGVWITCFVAFDMKSPAVRTFLDAWYLETLTRTTQDQISFPYVCQSLHMIPYTFPDDTVRGDCPHKMTDLYFKHSHGR